MSIPGQQESSAALRERQVRADLIASIYSHIPRSSLGVLAGAVTVAWGMWGQVAHSALLGWLGCIGAVLICRLYLHRAFHRGARDPGQVAYWQRRWTWSTAVHGTIWGSTAVFMYVPGSPEYQALLLVALFAISTAAVPLIGRHLPSLYAFVLAVLLPIIVRLAIEGGAERLLLAIISALVMYGIFLFGAELNRTITESVRRRYENVELIDQLTDQKAQAEAARREADQANLSKTRFLAAASHDLRQPMHALGLFSDSLRRRITDPEQHALADRICQSVEAIEQTFDTLLDISRLDAGVVQPKKTAFRLRDLLDRVQSDCAAEAAAKGLVLRVVTTRLAAYSDPVLVEQVVRNLVTNAIRYTDRGSVLLGCRPRGRWVSVEVWDTGIGIPADKKERIFDEFYQAAERDRREGLGLGLAIVRRVTRLLGAQTSVESSPGKGSVFRFRVPRSERLPAPRNPTGAMLHASARSLADAVVLVIDDDPSVLDAMSELLRGWGVRAVAARSLGCALARLPECERYPDAIVSDFRLGQEENGIDAVARIRHELGLAVPAMIVTGDTAPRSLRVIQASGLRCLPKPVTAERLLQELSALLGRDPVTGSAHG
ncbi:MAG: hybrid sensor histidine kinase/response regulator [Burkholderiales bacterium]|nr:hybrid sensor histidine kinase/response regulator [Burkholderiales bacterium]